MVQLSLEYSALPLISKKLLVGQRNVMNFASRQCNKSKRMERENLAPFLFKIMIYQIKSKGDGKPTVAIVGCVHGEEKIGQKIIDRLKNIKINQGTLTTIIANNKALGANKRFINQDLNRSFPGKRKGNYEEKLAYALKKEINLYDYVIDIHSTTTNTKFLVILTKVNRSIFQLINLFKPRYAALMKKSFIKSSLVYYAKAGISLEYGKDKSKIAEKNIINDILLILKGLNMIDMKTKIKKQQTEFYEIIGTIKKPKGFIANKKIINLKVIKKGDVVAINNKKNLKASRDFYPILFGPKAYKDIFGFMAKKIDIIDLK
ncbi:MAG: hypothetical protein C0412_13805 [Flavobacterium sp.]|nr:hypothetical protein [Flavobacterium sp.]